MGSELMYDLVFKNVNPRTLNDTKSYDSFSAQHTLALFVLEVASLADALLACHAILGRKDSVTSQKSVLRERLSWKTHNASVQDKYGDA